MIAMKSGPLGIVTNRQADGKAPYDQEGRSAVLSLAALAHAKAAITGWPGYARTSLRQLPGMARAAGVANIFYKDEGARFGLGSFKALGGAYAVMRLLQKQLRESGVADAADVDAAALARGDHQALTETITVTCATDGNHGKSVAWGARTFGCQCVIYVHAGVSQERRAAIAAYGADVREVSGTYDDAVRFAAAEAARHHWHVVSDTSYEGYVEVPRDVMQGYALIAEEICDQLPADTMPTHIFIQGGVGGLAAAICAYFWERFGARAPAFFVSEPDRANCLQLSAQAGVPVAAQGALDTIMAGLACGEVSLLAWQILSIGASAYLTITDEAAAETMRVLADAPFGDEPIVAGESAVAGLAAFLLASDDAAAREQLSLQADSKVLIIGSEGATDPRLYEAIVGRSAASVIAAREQRNGETA